MADTTLIAGLVGVGGTVLGTALGAQLNARATRQLERWRAERQEREEQTRIQGAARLVWLDLARCDASLEWAATRRRWTRESVELPLDAWESYRDRLAVGLRDAEMWESVANAMAAVGKLRAALGEHRPTELSDGLVASVREAQSLVLDAAEVLALVAGLPRPFDRQPLPAGS